MLSRRNILTTASAGMALSATTARAATFGNPDDPAEGAVNVTNPKALTDPGPQDQGLAGNEPAFLDPPATDVNGMPQYWAHSTSHPSKSRMAVGRARSRRTTSRSRRRSPASTCASDRRGARASLAPASRMGGDDVRQLSGDDFRHNGAP